MGMCDANGARVVGLSAMLCHANEVFHASFQDFLVWQSRQESPHW